MGYKKLENILLYVLLVIVGVVYLYTVAPTLSFWDCGEFIASAYTLAIPHPPGTPFYVFLGRAWLILMTGIAAVLPISKEVAWHMNLLGLGISVITAFLMYKMMLKIFRMWRQNSNQLTLVIVAFATCLGTSFFFTVWENAIETEVYASATFAFILINYLALLWYESVKQGTPKHKYLLLSFYIIFLSTGIHLTPFLIFIPFYVFIFIIERRYLKDTLLLLLGVFQVLFFGLQFLLPRALYTPGIVVLGLILVLALMLAINNPRKYRNWRFFWAGIFLIIVGISTELYLPIRAARLTQLYKDETVKERYLAGENIAPRINECDPGENFSFGALFNYNSAFNNVLHRAQYGPAKIIPRQTQEETGFGIIEGYFWQLALFIRYLSWQPVPEESPQLLRAIVLALFYVLSIWGMVELYKREKKIFLFMLLIMFMLSFAMVGYLNLKFSPSDANPQHQPREVRERDYFFHTGHTYFGIFIGFGFIGFIDWLKRELKNKKLATTGGLSAIVAFSLIPLATNFRVNNRHGNFIPKDYGYNMLASCDDGAVVFTNGDNDTFPLWFAQEVLGTKRSVVIANLSLINTDWYIKQLKYWGAPISFSEYVIKRLQPQMTRDRRIIWVKDIMVRNIIATNAGIKLTDEDYFISQEEFATRYLKDYKGEKTIYFASTVSPENFEGFQSYLQLEGLVWRLTGDSIPYPYNIDVPLTKEFFYNTYRYTGLFKPDAQEFLSTLLTNFDERKREGEFYNYSLMKDYNTRRLYSNYAAGLFHIALALREQGDFRGAVNAWRFALLFEPAEAYPFLYNLGILFAQLGMQDSAEYYFSQIDVRDPELMARIGMLYRQMGNFDVALEYFQKAIALDPRYPQAYIGLYSVALDKNDTTAAVLALEKLLEMYPRDTSILNALNELRQR